MLLIVCKLSFCVACNRICFLNFFFKLKTENQIPKPKFQTVQSKFKIINNKQRIEIQKSKNKNSKTGIQFQIYPTTIPVTRQQHYSVNYLNKKTKIKN